MLQQFPMNKPIASADALQQSPLGAINNSSNSHKKRDEAIRLISHLIKSKDQIS